MKLLEINLSIIFNLGSYLSSAILSVVVSMAFLGMVACSNTTLNNSKTSTAAIPAQSKQATKKNISHSHPENICYDAPHKHAGGEIKHKHELSCIKVQNGPANAHIHSVNKVGRSFRHVHPNGAKKHSH